MKTIFENKVAIITGAASGIGRSLAQEMASRGAVIIIADRNKTEAEKVVEFISRKIGKAYFHQVDVTNEKEVYDLVQHVYDTHGTLDYVFNNAGISSMSEFDDFTSEQWKKIININVLGVVYGSTAAYKIMKKQGHGYIINTSSAAAFGPAPLTAAYGATKHAVLALTTSLHYEAEAYGVKVSAVCPAFVTTSITDNMEMNKFDRNFFSQNTKNYISAEKCANIILQGIEKEKLIITTIGMKKTTDFVFTLFPGLQRKLMKYVVKMGRKAKVRD